MVVPNCDAVAGDRGNHLRSPREVDRFGLGRRPIRIADPELNRRLGVQAELERGHCANIADLLRVVSPFCDNEHRFSRIVHDHERGIEERRGRQYRQDTEEEYGRYGQDVEDASNHFEAPE